MNPKELEKLGLTEGEAKVFLALTELGSSTVGPIVKKSKVAYSNIYEILERLIEKGIVSFIIINKTKHFQSVSPSNLLEYLNKKEIEIVKQKETLSELIPRLEKLKEQTPKQNATLFIGLKGLRAAYEELFKEAKKGEENLWVYSHNENYSEQSDNFYLHNWFELSRKYKIKSRGVANNSYASSKFAKKFKKKFELCFVEFPIFSHGETFGDRFLLVSWEDPVISVLITAKHVSENFNRYFESVWKIAKLTTLK